MAKGPLAVRWGDWTLDEPHAGAVGLARVELENAGTVAWRDGIRLAYHWLDDRDNPIVWDGERTPLPELAPGERATVEARVRAPIPPGRYRFAFDLVAEHRAWFSELGSETASADVDVLPRAGAPRAELPGVGRAGARTRRSASPPPTPRATPSSPARSPGTAASAAGGRGRSPPTSRGPAGCRASRSRCSARPCSTASSSSASPTSPACPRSPRRPRSRGSTTAGSSSRRSRAGGRVVGCLEPGQSSTAIRSSIRLKTNEPSASATTAATAR